jgi:hypothetical protein
VQKYEISSADDLHDGLLSSLEDFKQRGIMQADGAQTNSETPSDHNDKVLIDEDYSALLDKEAATAGVPHDADLSTRVSAVAARARIARMEMPNIYQTTGSIDNLFDQYNDPELLSMAVSLIAKRDILVMESERKSLDLIIQAANITHHEWKIVDFSEFNEFHAPGGEKIDLLYQDMAQFPAEGSLGRVLILCGIDGLSRPFKRQLISGLLKRKIGRYPIPAGVKFSFQGVGALELEDFPPELLLQSVCLDLSAKDQYLIDQMKTAADTRSALIKAQLVEALEKGDERAAISLNNLLKSPGYLGGWDATPILRDPLLQIEGSSNNDVDGETDGDGDEIKDFKKPSAINSAYSLLTKLDRRGLSIQKNERAAFILDVIRPQPLDNPKNYLLRERVCEKILTGMFGREFSQNCIANYLHQYQGAYASLKNLNEFILGKTSVAEIKASIAEGGAVYIKRLALEMKNSPVVASIIEKKDKENIDKLKEIFLMIYDEAEEDAKGILTENPIFAEGE